MIGQVDSTYTGTSLNCLSIFRLGLDTSFEISKSAHPPHPVATIIAAIVMAAILNGHAGANQTFRGSKSEQSSAGAGEGDLLDGSFFLLFRKFSATQSLVVGGGYLGDAHT